SDTLRAPRKRCVLPYCGFSRGMIRSAGDHLREKTLFQKAATPGWSFASGRLRSTPCRANPAALAVVGSSESGGAGEVYTPVRLVGISSNGSDRGNTSACGCIITGLIAALLFLEGRTGLLRRTTLIRSGFIYHT